MMEQTINREQDKRIDSKVTWIVFVWAIGFLTVFIGVSINLSVMAGSKAEISIERISDVEGDIKAINANINSILENVKDIKRSIK